MPRCNRFLRAVHAWLRPALFPLYRRGRQVIPRDGIGQHGGIGAPAAREVPRGSGLRRELLPTRGGARCRVGRGHRRVPKRDRWSPRKWVRGRPRGKKGCGPWKRLYCERACACGPMKVSMLQTRRRPTSASRRKRIVSVLGRYDYAWTYRRALAAGPVNQDFDLPVGATRCEASGVAECVLIAGIADGTSVSLLDVGAREFVEHLTPGRIGVLGQDVAVTEARQVGESLQLSIAGNRGALDSDPVYGDIV